LSSTSAHEGAGREGVVCYAGSAQRGSALARGTSELLSRTNVARVSALDNQTERAVQQAFDTLAKGRTTITVAHRLSTVHDADQIVVLDHGHAIENGTHTSLIQDNGRYAELAA
jgi:ABC-type transport system involved in Fe-S cluster assembly fused permease/ATPase subunit